MTIESELKRSLEEQAISELVEQATSSSSRDVLDRDIMRRGAEIELALSAETAARDEARAAMEAANAQMNEQTTSGSHWALLVAALVLLAGFTIFGLLSANLNWSIGDTWLASRYAPFWSGLVPGLMWGATAIATITALLQAFYFLWQRPRRKLKLLIDLKITSLREEVSRAEDKRQAQLVELTRGHLIDIINLARGPRWSASLRVRDDGPSGRPQALTIGAGLAEVINDDNRVPTSVQQELLHLITSAPCASIGISGPRGVGKSSLLAALCASNPTISGTPAIAINTAAPVEYDGRDFLLHLFASLCRQILRTEGQDNADDHAHRATEQADEWRRRVAYETLPRVSRLTLFAGLAVMLVASGLSYAQSYTNVRAAVIERARVEADNKSLREQDERDRATAAAKAAQQSKSPQLTLPPFTRTPPLPLPAVPNMVVDFEKALSSSSLLAFGLAAFILGWVGSVAKPFVLNMLVGRAPLPARYYMRRGSIVSRAANELRNIHFQRSFTTGWSGTLKIPLGVDAAMTGAVALAERPESLPELVERFRNFVAEVAREYDNVVLIGIDELDKLKNAQQAEAFLNGVKSVFCIPHCFFMISVSEHALASFERRGLGFRDAFDSALDDIVRVDFLTLDQSRALLNRRILRLPDSFLQICHMLSGGLPRDLIRHARALLKYAGSRPHGRTSLIKAAAELTACEVEARLRAASIRIRTLKEMPLTAMLQVALADLPARASLPTARKSLEEFKNMLGRIEDDQPNEDVREALRICDEAAVFYELIILTRQVASLVSTKTGWEIATDKGLAQRIAGVRQALETGVPLAEDLLKRTKAAIHTTANAVDRRVNPHLYKTGIASL